MVAWSRATRSWPGAEPTARGSVPSACANRITLARAPGSSGYGPGPPEKSFGATTVSRLATTAAHTAWARSGPTPVEARASPASTVAPHWSPPKPCRGRPASTWRASHPAPRRAAVGPSAVGGPVCGLGSASAVEPNPTPAATATRSATHSVAASRARAPRSTEQWSTQRWSMVPTRSSWRCSHSCGCTTRTAGGAGWLRVPAPRRRPRRRAGANPRAGVPTRGRPCPHTEVRRPTYGCGSVPDSDRTFPTR